MIPSDSQEEPTSCNQEQRRNPNLELEVRRRSYEDEPEINGSSINRYSVIQPIFSQSNLNQESQSFRLSSRALTPSLLNE